jgi:hypothetical protein
LEEVEFYSHLWNEPPPNLYLLSSPDGFHLPIYKSDDGGYTVVSIDDEALLTEVVQRMKAAGVPVTDSGY